MLFRSKVLEMLTGLRGELTIPVILFTYSNPLLNRGMEAFCRDASAAGAAKVHGSHQNRRHRTTSPFGAARL